MFIVLGRWVKYDNLIHYIPTIFYLTRQEEVEFLSDDLKIFKIFLYANEKKYLHSSDAGISRG